MASRIGHSRWNSQSRNPCSSSPEPILSLTAITPTSATGKGRIPRTRAQPAAPGRCYADKELSPDTRSRAGATQPASGEIPNRSRDALGPSPTRPRRLPPDIPPGLSLQADRSLSAQVHAPTLESPALPCPQSQVQSIAAGPRGFSTEEPLPPPSRQTTAIPPASWLRELQREPTPEAGSSFSCAHSRANMRAVPTHLKYLAKPHSLRP